MKIVLVGADWGCPGATFTDRCRALADAGFTAVEVQPERDAQRLAEQAAIVADHGLRLILQPHTQGPDPSAHRADLLDHLARAEVVRPWFITCHTGLDHFGTAANVAIAEAGEAWSQRTGIQVLHEVHRKRICYNAMAGAEAHRLAPWMRFTADFSHWVVAHENWLDDPGYALADLFPACRHIHARVGHPQGPQVADPRSPEWQPALERHLVWWDAIVAARRAAGDHELPICPEFGPPDYCPTMPNGGGPIADVFAINCWIGTLLVQRYR